MNGSISVNSSPGKGAEFIIRFNEIKCSLKQVIKRRTIHQIDKSKFQKATILIVDDNENNRHFLKEIFKRTRIKVCEACDGKTALELINEEKPDLIITDILMPVMDGHQLISEVKKNEVTRNIPFIATSASLNPDHKRKLKKAGVNDFISKPIQLRNLLNLLAKHIPLEEEVVIEKQEKIMLDFDRFPNLKEKLDQGPYNLWKELQEKQPMNLVKEFTAEINKIGNEFGIKQLTDYGQKLNNAITAFDIDQILKLLSVFPVMIGKKNH